MQPPQQIQVGPYRYTVTVDDQEIMRHSRERATDLIGNSEHRTLQITMRPEQAPDMMADTLLHEVLHALCGMTGITRSWTDDDEESMVNRLSPALLDTLRRNPDLVRYLLQE